MNKGISISENQKEIATELMIYVLNDGGFLNKLEPLKFPKNHLLCIASECEGLSLKDAHEIIGDEESKLSKYVNDYWESLQLNDPEMIYSKPN